MTGRYEGLWTAACCSWLNQGGTTELLKLPSLDVGVEAFLFCRLLKAAVSFVLGLKTSSTYRGGYACGVFLASGLAEQPL